MCTGVQVISPNLYLGARDDDGPVVCRLGEGLDDVLPVAGHVAGPVALEHHASDGRGQEVADGLGPDVQYMYIGQYGIGVHCTEPVISHLIEGKRRSRTTSLHSRD